MHWPQEGGKGGGWVHVDLNQAVCRSVAIGHRHGDGLAANAGAKRSEGDQAVGVQRHRAFAGNAGAHQIDVIAVGIGKVGQDVVAYEAALLHRERGCTYLHRRSVIARAIDGERDLGLGWSRRCSPIGHGVAERCHPFGVGHHGQLECSAVVDRDNRSERLRQPVDAGNGQNPARLGGVVIQDRKNDGAARPNAKGVRGRQRIRDLVRALGELRLRCFDRRLVLLRVLGILDRIPGWAHPLGVIKRHPHVAALDVIEHHAPPVHPEYGRHRGVHRLERGDLYAVPTVGHVVVFAARPGPEHAGPHANGSGSRALPHGR